MGYQATQSAFDGLRFPSSWHSLQELRVDGKLSPTQMQTLISTELPELHCLKLVRVVICSQVAAELAKGRWPVLQSLDLCSCKLTVPALRQLARAQWPQMRHFSTGDHEDLDRARCDVHTVDPLTEANWPHLESLDIGLWECIHLSSANPRWPNLKSISLSSIFRMPDASTTSLTSINLHDPEPQSVDFLLAMQLPLPQKLVVETYPDYWATEILDFLLLRGNWPALTILLLAGQGLLSSGPLATCCCPNLKQMRLLNCHISTAAIRLIVSCKLCKLEVLDLAESRVDEWGLEYLTHAQWPLLKTLNLGILKLRYETVQHLITAYMPMLEHLDLGSCTTDQFGFAPLMKGQWPHLQQLDISSNCSLSSQRMWEICCDETHLHTCKFASLLREWVQISKEARWKNVANGNSFGELFKICATA